MTGPVAAQQAAPTDAAVPAVGTSLLASLPTDGRVNVIANVGAGFSVVQSLAVQDQDRSTVSVYDTAGHPMATLPAGALTGECGAADVSPDGHRLIVTALISVQPAQGINAARYSLDLTAWDAQTAVQAWKTNLVNAETTAIPCGSDSGQLLSGAPTLAISADGSSGVLHLHHGYNDTLNGVLDLATGQLVPRPDAAGILGNVVVLDPKADDPSAPDRRVTLADPRTMTSAGTLPVSNGTQHPGVLLRLLDFPSGSFSGVFPVISAGSSPDSGVSDDGSELFAYEYDAAAYSKVVAYRLPTGIPLWTQPRKPQADLQLVAEGGGVLVGRVTAVGPGPGDTTMVGLDATTGAQKWTLPEFYVCGITRTQMLVAANQQVAVVDLASGKQLSFTGTTSAGGANCPVIFPGGIEVSPGGPVVQALTP